MRVRLAHISPMQKSDDGVNFPNTVRIVRPFLEKRQTTRSTSIFLISPIALAGFKPFGQTWAQFMIVWQR